MASHSNQGATADRVPVHVDTEQAHEQLINSRLAYVSVSRGRYDAQIFTNDAEKSAEELRRELSKQSGLEACHAMGAQDQSVDHQLVSESCEFGESYEREH